MTKVIWYPVPGYEGLYVNRLGQVGVGESGEVNYKAGDTNGDGYLSVTHRGTRSLQHVLVALLFHGPKPGPKYEVNHKDDDRSNNLPGNLEWVTRKQNIAHAFRSDKSDTRAWEKHKAPTRRLSDPEVVEFIRDIPYMSVTELRDKYKVPIKFARQLIASQSKQRNHKDSPHFEEFDYDNSSNTIDIDPFDVYTGVRKGWSVY